MPYGLDSNPETCTFSHGRCVSPGRTTLVGIPRWWNLQPSFAITDGESQSRLLAVADGVFTVILLEPKSDSSRQKYQDYVIPVLDLDHTESVLLEGVGTSVGN